MGFFNEETLAMLDIFQQEIVQLDEELSQILLGAETRHGLSLEDIHSVFRVVHTVKSSSAMMGLSMLSEYAHRLEDLFQIYREQESVPESESDNAIALIYTFQEYLESESSKMTDEDYMPKDPTEQLKELSAYIEIPVEMPVERPEIVQELHIQFAADCSMKAVRAFMLVRDIQKTAKIISQEPEDLDADSASGWIEKNGLFLKLETENADKIYELLKKDKNVVSVEIPDENGSEKKSQTEDLKIQNRKEDHSRAEDHSRVEDEKTKSAVVNKSTKYTNVKWNDIQNLQNCIGELLVAYSVFENKKHQLQDPKELDDFEHTYLRVVKNLENISQSVSMLSMQLITPQLYRTVREVARKEKKDVDLVVQGDELEVDKNLLDMLGKPFVHILRNAVDHGIEEPSKRVEKGKNPKGKVFFHIENEGGIINISIRDDGKGMDTERILDKAQEKGMLLKKREDYTKEEIMDFVLRPGFSTNSTANEFSGRGVGMDVVRDTIEDLGGSMSIRSVVDEGTNIILKIPVTMTSVESICFTIESYIGLLPARQILKIYSDSESERITEKDNCRYFCYEDELLPILDMRDVFAVQKTSDRFYYLILQGLKYKLCLQIDTIAGQQIAVEKPLPSILGKNYRQRMGISGCVLMGDGRIGYMLNTDTLYGVYQKGLEDAALNKRNS